MTMLDIKLKFAFTMICTYLPSPSFLGFTSIIEEFICGEGIHKSNSNAIISDFLCRAFYVVIPKYITNVASSIYLPCASHSNFLAYKWRKGSKEVRHDFIQMFGMIWKDCPGGRIFFSGSQVVILAPIPRLSPTGKNELSHPTCLQYNT